MLPYEALPVFGKGYDGRCQAVAFAVGNNDWLPTLHHRRRSKSRTSKSGTIIRQRPDQERRHRLDHDSKELVRIKQ